MRLRKILVVLGLTALLAALGCNPRCVDGDGDGYHAAIASCPGLLGGDCDDRDPELTPEDVDLVVQIVARRRCAGQSWAIAHSTTGGPGMPAMPLISPAAGIAT